MSELLPLAPINLPLKILRGLMYDFPELEDIQLQSPALGDYARPKKAPFEVGELLRSLDPTESLFHVELFTNSTDPFNIIKHSEIWHAYEWAQSNAKLHKSKNGSVKRIYNYEQGKLEQSKQKELVELLEDNLGTAFNSIARHQFAVTIAKNYQSHNLDELLKQLGLLETLIEFKERYK